MHTDLLIGEIPVAILSRKDRAVLKAAASVLEALRAARETAANDSERDDETTVDIALAGQVCREISETETLYL